MVSGGGRRVVAGVSRPRGRHGRVAGGRAAIPGPGRRVASPVMSGEPGVSRGAVRQLLEEGVALLPPVVLVTSPISVPLSAPAAAPAPAPAAALLAPARC